MIVAYAGRDAVDAGGAKDESGVVRTAKSCGPDASTLASSLVEATPRDDGDKKARSPGSNCVLRRPVIGRPQGWRWRAPAFGG
jgi:hypothetical protein